MPPGSANRELRSSEFLLEDVKLLLVYTVIYFLMMLKIPEIYSQIQDTAKIEKIRVVFNETIQGPS